jgi:hypothetical protein
MLSERCLIPDGSKGFCELAFGGDGDSGSWSGESISSLTASSLSETAGSPATHRPVAPMLLPLTTILGQTGYSYALGPAVSERRALPAIRGSQIPPSADLFLPLPD